MSYTNKHQIINIFFDKCKEIEKLYRMYESYDLLFPVCSFAKHNYFESKIQGIMRVSSYFDHLQNSEYSG